GLGFSQPAVQCEELKELELDWLDSRADWEDVKPDYIATVEACRDRLVASGIDLTTFSSATSAADVDAIRRALGYEQWNLWGVSYGTRLAQTVMRDFPAGVRSVILDSAYPTSADLFENYPRSLNQAFTIFFNTCKNDPECNANYPNLEDRFYAVVEDLNENPVEIEIDNFWTGESHSALFWGDNLVGMLFQALYTPSQFIQMPDIIDDLESLEMEDAILMEELSLVNGEFFSSAIYRTIQCREEYPFSSVEDANVAIQTNVRLIEYFDDYDFQLELCDVWQAGEASSIENDPVSSDIPTLILAGGFDPVTPPVWGESLQRSLSNSYFVNVPELAHGIFSHDGCTQSVGLAFVDNPSAEPDSSCTADIPAPVFDAPD
ncbi:MAG: alpha/beta fold hydrolase, partial [Chloroflexota bacterium]